MTDGRVGESSQSFKVVLPDVNVPLSEHWQRFVAEQVRSGRFPSEAAILEKALALSKQQERPLCACGPEPGSFEPRGRKICPLSTHDGDR